MFTETWLNNSVPDCAIQLEQLTCYRADRALVEGGKRRGGGLCVYIHNVWCRDAVVVCKHCSPLVEFMIIKCLPFYLLREYTAILLVAVYIPPNSNNTGVRHWIICTSTSVSSRHWSSRHLAGDFNHADLKECVPENIPACWLPNKGKKYAGLCLHHPERSIQGPPSPPPRSLRPHHCHANACIQTAR